MDLMAQIREEDRIRSGKENNIVLSGVKESTSDDDGYKEVEDLEEAENILKELTITNAARIKKIYRRGRNTKGPRNLVVELCDKETRDIALRNGKLLKMNLEYSTVYVNKDLTRNEIEEEKAARKLRNERNNNLEHNDGNLKFGKTSKGTEFYWGIRSGKLQKIDRATKKILNGTQ